MTLNLPRENYVGSILEGCEYRLGHLRCQDDYLDIYSVTNTCGLSFEAQAFSISGLPAKLFQARKRRMKRICLSQNYFDQLEQTGKRFLISTVERSDAELKNLDRHFKPIAPSRMNRDILMKEFPDLPPSPCSSRRSSSSSFSISESVGSFNLIHLTS